MMKFDDLFISSFVKTKLVLILLSILLSVACSGFITYQILDLINAKQNIDRFREEITNIVKVRNIEASLDEDLQEITNTSNQSNVLFSYSNNRSTTNPFRSLLTKKGVENELKAKEQIESQSEVVDKPVNSKQDNSTVKESEIIKPAIKVLGILGSHKDKRAILQWGDSKTEVYIVKVKEEIKGLKVKSITDSRVIITKQNRYFSYEFGG